MLALRIPRRPPTEPWDRRMRGLLRHVQEWELQPQPGAPHLRARNHVTSSANNADKDEDSSGAETEKVVLPLLVSRELLGSRSFWGIGTSDRGGWVAGRAQGGRHRSCCPRGLRTSRQGTADHPRKRWGWTALEGDPRRRVQEPAWKCAQGASRPIVRCRRIRRY